MDSEYEIKFIEEGNIKFQKTNKKYNDNFTIKEIFVFSDNYNLDNVIDSFVHIFLIMWLNNYGYSRGDIYFLGNQNSIIEFMKTLRENNFFNLRKEYVNNNDNYNLSNTAFAIKKMININFKLGFQVFLLLP